MVRKILRYTWILVILAVLYVAWIFYMRYERSAAAEAALAKQKQEEAQHVSNLVFGSGEIQFTTFSADTGVLHRGETTELCYGVVNAVRVELDPPIEPAKSTYRHCVEIAPKQTTTYTIKATDGKGHTKTESLTVQVR